MKNAAAALLVMLLAGCGHGQRTLVNVYNPEDFGQHKHTIWLKLHWNYLHPGDGTIVADGYVEPFSPSSGLNTVRLELVGLNENGEVVNSASGMPRDNYIITPIDESPFRISMPLNGREKRFTIRGSYYYTEDEWPVSSDSRFDYIPLDAGNAN